MKKKKKPDIKYSVCQGLNSICKTGARETIWLKSLSELLFFTSSGPGEHANKKDKKIIK
jgi:hypothetical protein